jgi:hypothetical protein
MNEHSNHPIYHPATHRGLGHQLDKVCDPRTAVVVATEACIARSKPVSFTRPLPFAAGEHRPSIEPTIEGDAPGGFPQAANGFRPHPKRLSPLSPRGRKGRTSLCEWPDSNPTHTSRDDQPSRVPAVTTQACAVSGTGFSRLIAVATASRGSHVAAERSLRRAENGFHFRASRSLVSAVPRWACGVPDRARERRLQMASS